MSQQRSIQMRQIQHKLIQKEQLMISLQTVIGWVLYLIFAMKEEGILKWASFILEEPVTKFKDIHHIGFISKLLHRIDRDYFELIHPTFEAALDRIRLYYAQLINIDVSGVLKGINTSNDSTELWELVFGIAIKGKERDYNINIILKMEPASQNHLMALVSDITRKFGDKVYESRIESAPQSRIQENEDELLIQMEEENKVLKEVIRELEEQQEEMKRFLEKKIQQVEAQSAEKRDFIAHLTEYQLSNHRSKQLCQFAPSFSLGLKLPQIAKQITEFLTYLLQSNKEETKRNQQLTEASNNIKLAFQKLSEDNDQLRSDLKLMDEIEREVEEMRANNRELMERQTGLLQKITELQEQRYYLREALLRTKKVAEPRQMPQQQPSQGCLSSCVVINEAQQQTTYFQPLSNQIGSDTVSYDKLSKQINHLEKKVQQLDAQNRLLRKENAILNKSLDEFVEEKERMAQEWERSVKNIQRMTLAQQPNNQQNDREALQQIKAMMAKMKQNEVGYLSALRNLEIENQCLTMLLKEGKNDTQKKGIQPSSIELRVVNDAQQKTEENKKNESTKKDKSNQIIQGTQKSKELSAHEKTQKAQDKAAQGKSKKKQETMAEMETKTMGQKNKMEEQFKELQEYEVEEYELGSFQRMYSTFKSSIYNTNSQIAHELGMNMKGRQSKLPESQFFCRQIKELQVELEDPQWNIDFVGNDRSAELMRQLQAVKELNRSISARYESICLANPRQNRNSQLRKLAQQMKTIVAEPIQTNNSEVVKLKILNRGLKLILGKAEHNRKQLLAQLEKLTVSSGKEVIQQIAILRSELQQVENSINSSQQQPYGEFEQLYYQLKSQSQQEMKQKALLEGQLECLCGVLQEYRCLLECSELLP